MKQLIIAEKPSLAMAIVAGIGRMEKQDGYFENEQYLVSFAFGHLFALKSIDEYLQREKTPWKLEELPFIPERFEYRLREDTGIKKQYKIIQHLYKRNDVTGIINAGDPDREGSVIILNILHQLIQDTGQTKPVQRIWLKATTPDYVREALKDLHPEEYYGNLYEEGLARTYIDWLYGMNYTRYLTLKAGALFPVGRVLVPIVKFIYDRGKAVQEFQPEPYFTIDGMIEKDGQRLPCQVKGLRYAGKEEAAGREKLIQLQKENAVVDAVDIKDIKKQPPKLFSLDTLQNKLSREASLSPSETLELVQKLYESGYVTYPRTNTEYLADAEQESVQKLLELFQTTEPPLRMRTDKGIFNNDKIEGHTALIPTRKIPYMSSLTEKEQLVYVTIRNRFLANFLIEETVIQETRVTIRIGPELIDLTGNAIKQEGFYQYEKSKAEIFLPVFTVGEVVQIRLELAAKVTSPPSSVTEAELIDFLKRPFKRLEIEEAEDDAAYRELLAGCEIGTVATRAGIIENALKYQYIKKEKKALKITDKGVKLILSLHDLGIDIEKERTVKLGMALKQVYQKIKTKEDVVAMASEEIRTVISKSNAVTIARMQRPGICKCPKCGGEMLEGKKNYYCSRYKDGCTMTVWKEVAGKKLTEGQIKQLCEKHKTALLKGFTSKSGKTFEAKLMLKPDFTIGFEFAPKN